MGRGLILRCEVSEEILRFIQPTLVDWRHLVLARLSPGYSKPEGRLPTCYSPVRRSTHPKTFARDLHVLGTPPAFVLSQDQTLQLTCAQSAFSMLSFDQTAKRRCGRSFLEC